MSSPVEIRISLQGDFSQPVTLARILKQHGLTLPAAHKVLNELAEFRTVVTGIESADIQAAQTEIVDLGLAFEVVEAAETSDARR